MPGQWHEVGDEMVPTAAAEGGLTVLGRPLTGDVRLTAARGAIPRRSGSRTAIGA